MLYIRVPALRCLGLAFLLSVTVRPSESTNIALGKDTYASSSDEGTRPPQAVDGDIETYFDSVDRSGEWWRVDLGDLYNVSIIKVYSRWYGRFKQVSLLTSDMESTTQEPIPGSSEWTVVMSGINVTINGDKFVTYIPLSADGNIPLVRHIGVYSTNSDGLVIGDVEVVEYGLAKNVAVGKSASSKSVYSQQATRVAKNAVDGLVNEGEFFRSTSNSAEWWKVDLNDRYFIVGAVIYNHRPLGGRLRKASLLVGNSNTNLDLSGTGWTQIAYQDTAIGRDAPNNYFEYSHLDRTESIPLARYVTVYSTHRYGMAISEVIVFGIGRSDMKVTSLSADESEVGCITISWQPPITGSTLDYQVKYGGGDWISITDRSLSHKKCEFSTYYDAIDLEVKVDGATESQVKQIVTPCADPSKPRSITESHEKVNEDGIDIWRYKFSWQVPSDINCESISRYKLKAPELGLNEIEIPDTSYQVSVDGGVEFTLSVRAVNNKEKHSGSETKVFTASEIEPQWGVERVQLLAKNSSCVSLLWKEPEYPGGVIISFQYKCTDMSSWKIVINITTNDTVCGYSPYQEVECEVRAENGAGAGDSLMSDTDTTQCGAPVLPAEISSYISEKAYQLENATYRVLINLSLPETDIKVNCWNLTKLVYRVDSEEEYRPIGEQIDDLKTNTAYIVEVKVVNNDGYESVGRWNITTTDSVKPEAVPEGVREVTESPGGICVKGCLVGTVVGIIVGVLVLVVLVGGALIYRKRRKGLPFINGGSSYSSQATMEKRYQNDESTSVGHENEVTAPATKPRTSPPPVPPHARESIQPLNPPAIPLRRLGEYVQNNKEEIFHQHMVLGMQEKPQSKAALLSENSGKCKYLGIYPEDETRVKLDRPRRFGTDFINASFIKGYDDDDLFIAAQGPQPLTVDDFWLMIWQQKPKAIVMVTNICEEGRPKCKQYWPDGNGERKSFGDLTVTLTTTELVAHYAIRTLTVTKDTESMVIKQFHFLSWPDHNVPKYTSPFLTFVRRVMTATARMSGPLLIHCSAGVGRTGTFISLNILAKEAKAKQEINPYECVRVMRTRRPCMVQTKEQYEFLLRALEEYMVTDDFRCEPTDLETKLTESNDEIYVNRNLVSEEFNRIEQQLQLDSRNYSVGMEEENQMKNRFKDIVPALSHNIYADSCYINAVISDDYRQQNHVIATQLPLPNTVKDFWTMITEQDVKVIVQLQQQDDIFYPSKDSGFVDSDGCIISRTGSQQLENIMAISLTVKQKDKAHNIALLRVDDWSSEVDPRFPKPSTMLSYLGTLEKYQQKSGDGKICVMDMDGASRCGLFISAYNAVEKLKTEQEVDLYTSVLMARHVRHQFVSDLESYVYLYHLLQTYIEAFSDYGNFKKA